jgi:hypothetical protein
VSRAADESERIVLDMLTAGAVTYIRTGVGAGELTALLNESPRASARWRRREQ